jgi:hypothetical protein
MHRVSQGPNYELRIRFDANAHCMMQRPYHPLSLCARGLSRAQAATYIGVSPSLFDQMVGDGRMPKGKRINSRVVWDRMQLDEAFGALPDGSDDNPWDAP